MITLVPELSGREKVTMEESGCLSEVLSFKANTVIVILAGLIIIITKSFLLILFIKYSIYGNNRDQAPKLDAEYEFYCANLQLCDLGKIAYFSNLRLFYL